MALEEVIMQNVVSAMQESAEKGWDFTKQAMQAADPAQKDSFAQMAKETYQKPLLEIAQGFRVQVPSEGFIPTLRRSVIEVNINVFDLYRRVGKLEEALTMGKEAFKDAVDLDNRPTIFRAGNFLNLVYSAQAYKEQEDGNLAQALVGFRDIEKTFYSMPLECLEGKDAVMGYGNQSANYFNIIRTSLLLRVPYEELTSDIDHLEATAYKARSYIGEIANESERDRWEVNTLHKLGYAHHCRNNPLQAIVEYEKALAIAKKQPDNDSEIASISLFLADEYARKPEPDMPKAVELFQVAEKYLSEGGSFGVYDPIIEPLITDLKSILPS